MPARTLKTEQDCQDFVAGLKLLGTGGGGSPVSGMEMLTGALADGLTVGWIDAADLRGDVYSCTVFGSGSISEDRPDSIEGVEALGKKLGVPVKYGFRAVDQAVKELEAYAGVKVGVIVPVELGASNTAGPLVTAARLGIPAIDGDYSGRAAPQDMQATYCVKGIKTYPAAIVDWWGNVLILKEAATPEMGERIGKQLSISSYGVVYIASILLDARQTRETIIPGTLTASLELGQCVRKAREAGKDPVQAAAKALGGWKLFAGEVTGKDWSDKDGLLAGTIHIMGTGEFDGHMMDVWFLNENHVAWLDGKPYVFSPDLIMVADASTGEGYTNTEVKAGQHVAVLGAKIDPFFRSEAALKYYGPRYWGFDFDYVPIEKAVKR
jgi:DUF917 family protein